MSGSPDSKITLLEYLLVEGYPEQIARGLILSGRVLINDQVQTSPAYKIHPAHANLIRIKQTRNYVSRAAYKLLGAMQYFNVSAEQRICLDLGAAHGGFTQVLLEGGARKVYAIDVAYGIFDYNLRNDTRVHLLEKSNIRNIEPAWFAGDAFEEVSAQKPVLVVCDISFMSLRTVLAELVRFLSGAGKAHPPWLFMEGLFLLKPQFEDSSSTIAGIQRDVDRIDEIRNSFKTFLDTRGLQVIGSRPADIKGSQGNQEFIYYLKFGKL